ncbi:MAG: hypothetical protein R6X22_05470 [Gemmatimonadota bacterium]
MRRIPGTTLVILLAVAWTGCAPEQAPDTAARDAESLNPIAEVVEIVARGLKFEAPDTISSGWTTVRFRNESGMTHFALFDAMPPGYGIDEHQEQLAPAFQKGMDLLNAGDVDAAMTAFGEIPEWFGQVVFAGGPGLLAPGRTAETTVFLEPGTYVVECYVKTDGIFHSYSPDPSTYGMVHELTVTSDVTDAPEPEADIRLTISTERGIEVQGEPTAGDHVVAVHFESQGPHENMIWHDVNLARLAGDTDLEALAAWMDATSPGGLETPAPVVFVGGTNEMPAGSTAYVHVALEPGRYAWIAEVPRPDEKGMLKVFEVPAAEPQAGSVGLEERPGGEARRRQPR